MTKPLTPPNNKWTILQALNWTANYFETHHIDSPRISAEVFLAHVLNLKRIDLYLRYDQPLHLEELSRFKILIKRRFTREPVAYILGKREFWSLDLNVTPDTLIPRPETERLVEVALDCIGDADGSIKYRILDLGTGSGAIILALAKEKPGHYYFAMDRSYAALRIAKQNAKQNNLAYGVSFFSGDWLSVFKESPLFDIIVSNPPYIPTKTIETLQPEIVLFEPKTALDGGETGFDCLKEIAANAPRYLKPGGFLLMEMGDDQKRGMENIFKAVGQYSSIEFFKDYSGNDRVIKLKKLLR